MKYFKLFKVFPFLIHFYAGVGFFSPSHGLCRPPLPRSLFVVVETPVTGWYKKVEPPGRGRLQYVRTLQPVQFTLTLNRRGPVPYALSFRNVTADGFLTDHQQLHYDDITVLCPAELPVCSCRSLEVAGLDGFDGLYEMDEPAPDTAGDRQDDPKGAPVPGSKDEGHSPGGAGAQGDSQSRHWPTWSLREDARPTKPPVRSVLGNLLTNLNLDQNVLARLPGGVNTNHTTYLQITAAMPSSPGTGPPHDRGYPSEGYQLPGTSANGLSHQREHPRELHYPFYPTGRRGHVKSDRTSPDRPDKDMRASKRRDERPVKHGEKQEEKLKEKTTTKPKTNQFQQSLIPFPHELSHKNPFWSKPEKSFKQMLLDYDYVVPLLGKRPSQNTFKPPSKTNNFINSDYVTTFSKQSLERDDVSHFDKNPSGRRRMHKANHENGYGLQNPHLRQQSHARFPPQLASVPHATRTPPKALKAKTSPVGYVKKSSPPVTLPPIPVKDLPLSEFPLLDTSSNTVDHSAFEQQLQKQYSVRIQWDDELATLVLVRGDTLLAISDQSSLCPDTSSGSWWQLVDKPRSPANYTGHLSNGYGQDQDSGLAGTDRGHPGHSHERLSEGLEEPSILSLSSEEQNYADSFDLLVTEDQDIEARLEKRLVSLTCRGQRNKTMGQNWREG